MLKKEMYKIDYNQNKENCFLYRAILFVGLSTCYLFSMEKSSIISRVDISLPHNTTIYCNILAMLDEFVKNTKNMLYNLKHVNQYATHGRVPNVLAHDGKQFFMADGRKEKLSFRYMALDYIIASPNDDISLKNANKKAWYQYNSHRIDQNKKMFYDLLLYRQDGSIIHRDDKALSDNKKLKAVIGLKLILPNTFCNFHKFSQYIKYINQEYVSPELMKRFFELNKDWSVDEAEKIIEDPYMKLLYYFSNLIAFKHVVPLYVLFIVDPYIEVDVATMYKRPMLIPAHDNLPASYYDILCQPEQHYLIDIYLDPKCMKQKSKEKKIPQKQVYSVLSEFLKQYPFIHKMDILHNALFQLSMTMFIERVIPDNLNSIISEYEEHFISLLEIYRNDIIALSDLYSSLMKEKTKKYPFFWGPSLIQNTAYLPNKILAFPVDVFFAEHIIDEVLPNKNTVTSDLDEHRPQQQEILVTQQISEQDGVLPSSCQNSLDNTNVKQKERTSKRRVSKKKEKDVSCLQEQTKPNMAVQQVLDTLAVLPKPFYHEPFLVINEKYFNKMIDPATNKLFDFYHSVPAQIIHTLIHQGTKMPLPDVMNSGSNVFFEVVAIKTALNKYLYKVLCIIVDYNDVIYHFGLHKTLNAFKQLGDIVYKKEKDLRNAIDWPALSLEKMPVPNKKKIEMNNNKINVPSYAKLVPLSTFNTYFPCTEQPTYDLKMSRYKLPNSEGLIFLHTWNMNVKDS